MALNDCKLLVLLLQSSPLSNNNFLEWNHQQNLETLTQYVTPNNILKHINLANTLVHNNTLKISSGEMRR